MMLESLHAKGLLAAAALSLLAGHVALASSAPPAAGPIAPIDEEGDEEVDGGTPEDIEVLRRILVKELTSAVGGRQRLTPWATKADGSLDPNSPDALAGFVSRSLLIDTRLTSSLASSPVTHSRGYHVPGQGAFLSLDVEIPVVLVEIPAEDEKEEESSAKDLWEETRREMLERRSPGLSRYPQFGATDPDPGSQVGAIAARAWTLAPDALVAVEETVRRVLSQHGGRVRGLEPGESVSVALHLSPRNVVNRPTAMGDSSKDVWRTWAGSYSAARVATARMIVQGASGALVSGAASDALRVHRY